MYCTSKYLPAFAFNFYYKKEEYFKEYFYFWM
jgi:hypothetical protein